MKSTISRVMALDVGNARIGVALSDPMKIIAQPLTTLEHKKPRCFAEIAELVKKHSVETIVLGVPYELSGDIGPQAQIVGDFREALQRWLLEKNSNVQIVEIDERLSTAQAEHVVRGSDLKNSARSAALDRVAAAIILESFLEQKRTRQT